jgi:hypothetical protein
MNSTIQKHHFSPRAGNTHICATCREPEGAEIHLDLPKNGSSKPQNGMPEPVKAKARTKASLNSYVSLKFTDAEIYADLEAKAEEQGLSPSTYVFGLVADHLGYTYQPAKYVKKSK